MAIKGIANVKVRSVDLMVEKFIARRKVQISVKIAIQERELDQESLEQRDHLCIIDKSKIGTGISGNMEGKMEKKGKRCTSIPHHLIAMFCIVTKVSEWSKGCKWFR